jgi:crotonobetainyl-CoA:carnitine CoA-transferase CaiB-like acyl-CoA transferase
VLAILTALRHRARTGEGAYVDLSMLESTVALLPTALFRAALDQPDSCTGSASEPGAAPSGCFRCAGNDEWLAVSIRTDPDWQALCAIMRRPDLGKDDAFADPARRLQAKAFLDACVASWLRGRSATEAERMLLERGIPAARSRAIDDLVVDEHLTQRGVFRDCDGEKELSPLPWLAEDGWRGRSSATPAIGADNAYVFGEILGLSPSRQEELKAAGVIR